MHRDTVTPRVTYACVGCMRLPDQSRGRLETRLAIPQTEAISAAGNKVARCWFPPAPHMLHRTTPLLVRKGRWRRMKKNYWEKTEEDEKAIEQMSHTNNATFSVQKNIEGRVGCKLSAKALSRRFLFSSFPFHHFPLQFVIRSQVNGFNTCRPLAQFLPLVS